MKRFILSILFFLLLITNCFSQFIIKGQLLDNKNKPISDVSITITKADSNNIIGYDISDLNGNYSISIKDDLDKLQLNIRSISYKAIIKPIENKPQIQNFTLQDEITELKEVVLKSKPITQKGDTINYSVNSFSKPEDRTIADVLKNMPGIEVLSDGKILYQGKPINKYYIEGLDLLEGKYNLANNNLPLKDVAKVQILENHQPIKILDSLMYSDQAALNIKLKNKYTLTGQAQIGTGLSPWLWHTNATGMLFTKKQQMLTSYQSNNIGDNIAHQLKTLTIDELLEQFERNDEKQSWLAIQQLSIPSFTEQRWLNNNIHLVTTNYLNKLRKDYELRINLSFFNDYQQQNGITNTQFFTINDTIALLEKKYNKFQMNALETNITINKNTNRKFFKNSLEFKNFWDDQHGAIQLNNEALNQKLNNQYYKLSNNLKTLFPLGKQIITLNSYVGLNKTPQTLAVNPGQFNELLYDGNSYDEVIQNINLQTFYTNNSVGFTKGMKAFSFNPKIGLQFEKQNLESTINTSESLIFADGNNDLDWTRTKVYLQIQTRYKKNKWHLELTTPLNSHTYSLEDTNLQHGQNLRILTFEPRLSFNYTINSFWRFGTSANINNQFGSINQVHYAYILNSYRSIQRIDAPLPQMQNITYSTSIGYRNPLKSIFFSLIYSNIITTNNLLYNNEIIDNGATELQAIAQNNKRYSHNFISRYGKYFTDFETNLVFSVNYNLLDFVQIINSEITDIVNQNWQLNGKVDTNITDRLNTELETVWQFSNNELQGKRNEIITQQFYKFNMNIYPKENHYFAVKTEYIKNDLFSETAENIFTDLVYRYTWKMKSIDLELQWSNIFNTNNYRTVNIDNFTYTETNFNLRPSQLLFKIKFSL